MMMSWDDELLFFYILRTQFVFARIAAKPDDMIPGKMDSSGMEHDPKTR